jgi:hypothetical protein
MINKSPETFVAIYDIDGTLADNSSRAKMSPQEYYTPENVLGLRPNESVLKSMRKHMLRKNTYVTVISGREDKLKVATMQWLNKYAAITTQAVNPVLVFTRPENVPYSDIQTFKMNTALRMARRVGRPVIIECYEDDIEILKVYNGALKPLCRILKLFRVEGRTIVRWRF